MVGRQSRSQSSMALGGPVYQPTTVTYESGGGGCGGGGGGRWRARLSWPAPLLLRVGLLVGALVLTPVGLKLIIDGSLVSSTTNLVIGILLLLIGISLFGVLIHLWLRRRGGWPSDKQGVEAGGGVTGAALGAPNPSTDPLVAAQYAPVRDAPPADDERRQLMDNKECLSSAEESDRMLESDPRIVLRPLKNVDEA